MTKIIGLTGGIGSGKTTVARIFSEFGVPVYSSDDAAKEVMRSDEMAGRLKDVFGSEIFDNNVLDRKKLAAIVFSDKQKLNTLNGLVHPAVRTHFENWLALHDHDGFILRESAILFETGNNQDCDKIITVTAPLETRLKRVVERDGASREEVLKRMENQWSDDKKASESDFVISNVNLEQTRAEVVKILENLKKL